MRLLFHQGSFFGLRFLLASLFMTVFMMMDQKISWFHRFRTDLAVVVLPIQYAVDLPIRVIHHFATGLTTEEELLNENARLRAREFLLQSQLQKLQTLESENAELRQLLQSASKMENARVATAKLLAVNLDPNLQQVILNKGHRDHVYEGQPVFDAYGVMGQVVHVSSVVSKVMLITDVKTAIPVRDDRNGARAIAVGMGSSQQLMLINVPSTVDIRVGDLMVTSGLDMHYPAGYPVGVVSELVREPTQRFSKIILKPSAHLDQTQQVLLVWPSEVALRKAVKAELNADITSGAEDVPTEH